MDLFASIPVNELPGTPLPEKLRPVDFSQIAGQSKILKTIEGFLRSKHLPNLILWGPPGTGKTTIARILSHNFEAEFVALNAVEAGAKILKEEGEAARQRRRQYQKRTLLFVDEIHRFNKAQQDVLLPFIEAGELILVGATTENPSYELNRALLSRCKLLVLERLQTSELQQILKRASTHFQSELSHVMDSDATQFLIHWSDGDARRLISAFEEIATSFLAKAADPDSTSRSPGQAQPYSLTQISELLGSLVLGYDKKSDQHYDVISAFIKSLRGSDADAALYYLARMIKAGEDPVFIARRLVILASEDIGNADPRALTVAIAAAQAVEMIGLPEGAISLSQAVTYLASAPKSNRSYLAWKKAQALVEATGTLEIPLHLRSSQTESMKNLGYGVGYKYPHDFPKAWAAQNYWPEKLAQQKFYEASESGFEKTINEYQKWQKS